jgi:hypothetical protein
MHNREEWICANAFVCVIFVLVFVIFFHDLDRWFVLIVSLCVCVYIYIYTYTCIWMYICVYGYMYMCLCV